MIEPSLELRSPVPYLSWNEGRTKGLKISVLLVIVSEVLPSRPFFVVTTIAPLAADEP